MGSAVATEVCLFRTTGSELGLRRQTGMPWGEGVTRALATHTGKAFVLACSRMHGCEIGGHTELFYMCTHANTSNSQAGVILTVSTRETMSGELDGCGCGGDRGIGGDCETCRVRCPMSRTHRLYSLQEIQAEDSLCSQSICYDYCCGEGDIGEMNGDISTPMESEGSSIYPNQ